MLTLITPSALATYYLIQPDGSGDFPTIQAALDQAAAGDLIALANSRITIDLLN